MPVAGYKHLPDGFGASDILQIGFEHLWRSLFVI